MMYRDWREVTKVLLSAHAKDPHGGMEEARLPKSKMRRRETGMYVEWVKGEIRRDPGAFEGYAKGRGIIKTRERFLRWVEEGGERGEVGVELGGANGSAKEEGEKEWGKTVIVPIAIPGVGTSSSFPLHIRRLFTLYGSGKTSIAVALSHIFGWGHTQSDDVPNKKGAQQFLKNVQELLKTHDVVIADKYVPPSLPSPIPHSPSRSLLIMNR